MRGRRPARAGLTVAVLLAAAAAARGGDENVLRRETGIVTYKLAGAAPSSLVGSVSVGDAVIATTAIAALATLQLKDSSDVRIGDRTTVRVGDLRAAEGANPASATIVLERGALRFDVRHPAGARTNYRFVTPTTQLSIRGTLGYLVHGPTGDQIYCVRCDEGDVTIATGTQTVSLLSGQTLDVAVRNGTVAGSAIIPNRTVNNPAIDQFLGGLSPFGEPSAAGFDPTSSGSGRRT